MTWRHDFALPRVDADRAFERLLTVSDANRKAVMAELLALGYPDEGPTLGALDTTIGDGRLPGKTTTRARGARLLFSAGIAFALTLNMLAVGQSAFAAGPAPVGLGTAAPFAVLAGTPAITNTGPTTITGDLGISPAAAVTGFPPGIVNGTIHAADAVALQAQSDLTIAYTDSAGRTPATAVAGGTLGGLTLVGGVYNAGGATLGLTGTLTLDAQNDPSARRRRQATFAVHGSPPRIASH